MNILHESQQDLSTMGAVIDYLCSIMEFFITLCSSSSIFLIKVPSIYTIKTEKLKHLIAMIFVNCVFDEFIKRKEKIFF